MGPEVAESKSAPMATCNLWGCVHDAAKYSAYQRMTTYLLPGEGFQKKCQVACVQAGGGFIRIWMTYHKGTESPMVPLDAHFMNYSIWAFSRMHCSHTACTKNQRDWPQCDRKLLDEKRVREIPPHTARACLMYNNVEYLGCSNIFPRA